MQSKKLCYNLRHNLDEAYMRGSKKNFVTQITTTTTPTQDANTIKLQILLLFSSRKSVHDLLYKNILQLRFYSSANFSVRGKKFNLM